MRPAGTAPEQVGPRDRAAREAEARLNGLGFANPPLAEPFNCQPAPGPCRTRAEDAPGTAHVNVFVLQEGTGSILRITATTGESSPYASPPPAPFPSPS